MLELSRLIDALSILLLAAAAMAFLAGMRALTQKEDLSALYWLVVAGLTLRAATNMLRPKASVR